MNVPTQINLLPPAPYAGIWLRFIAFLVDTAILSVGFGLLAVILAAPIDFNFTIARMGGNITSVVLVWLYYALSESSKWQATLGKRLLKIKVTDLNGNRISFGRATGRYFGKMLSSIILCIGYIMIAFTKKQQGLHDIIAETLVVRE